MHYKSTPVPFDTKLVLNVLSGLRGTRGEGEGVEEHKYSFIIFLL